MAHYAFLDENNIVTEVIVGIDETELIEGESPEIWYGKFRNQTCIRTSYNGNIRKNYAGIGYSYDLDLDAFIPPKPFNSWLLDETVCQWQSPVPYPSEVPEGSYYVWNEDLIDWELMTPEETAS
jgi:hypothetical protein